MTHHKFDIISGGNKNKEKVQKATIFIDYFRNEPKKDIHRLRYRTILDIHMVYIHPSSSIFKIQTKLLP